MAPVAATLETNTKNLYGVKDAMSILFGKLDEAIDDIENGRTLSSKKMWIPENNYTARNWFSHYVINYVDYANEQ